MMKTTRQDRFHGRHALAMLSAALLVSVSAGVLAQQVAPVPGTRVTVTDGQLAAQSVPLPVTGQTAPAAPATPASTGSAIILAGQKHFPADGHFPQSGFVGATFQILANGQDANDNARYQWHSNQPWVTVDAKGTVTFIQMPTAATRTVTLTATPAAGGTPQTLTVSLTRWFINALAEKMTHPAAEAWCTSQGDGFALPAAAMLTASTDGALSPRAANGALWNEWGPMVLYRYGWQIGNYWASQAQDNQRKMVGLVNGNVYWVADSSSYLVTCVRGVQ